MSDAETAATAVLPVRERLVSRDYISVMLANFFNQFGSQMLTATLPVYVLTLGGTPFDAGVVSSAMAFTALLFRPVVGWITDAWRRRPLVLVGTTGYALASVVYFFAGSVPLLLLGRLVHGFGLANYTTASSAYLADIAPPSRRAEAIGLYGVAATAGQIIGPAAGFFIVEAFDFHTLFYFTGGLALTAFAVSWIARERRKPPATRARWTLRTGIIALDALPIAYMAMCLGMGFGPIGAFIAIFAQSRGIENPGFYFTVQASALVLSRTFGGRLADRRGRVFVMIPGTIMAAAALALLPFAYSFPQFLFSAALFGLGFGMVQPSTMALVVDRVRPEQRGLAMSTYFFGFDGGISLGSIGLGWVGQTFGFGVMWPLCSVCALLGLLGLLAVRKPAPEMEL